MPGSEPPVRDVEPVSDDLVAARIERWVAQDQAVVLERQLGLLQDEHALCADRLRRLADELLYQTERRRAAEATADHLRKEVNALRRTTWWRLGWLPRWVRSHIR
jgi:hypothetical protein